jgi:gentisate 1,2-dioxygenase
MSVPPTPAPPASRTVALTGDSPELLAFNAKAHGLALLPTWEFFQNAPPPQPVARERPFSWSWTEVLRPMMEEAFAVVDPSKAERRNLLLQNPGLSFAGTTHTLIAGVQGVLPGEVAPPHRHTAQALRFIIEGDGAATTVNGEFFHMRPRDLILTPQWFWHDQANETDHPVVWLDVLDAPLVMGLNQWFFEPGREVPPRPSGAADGYRRFGTGSVRPVGPRVADGPSPLLAYPWTHVEEALNMLAESRAAGDLVVEYNNPATGGPVLNSIGCYARMIVPGGRSRRRRTNASAVVHVIEGRGCALIGDDKLDWATGDCLAIPHWSWVQFENGSATDPAFLFSAEDAPLLGMLGILREEFAAT